MTNRLSYSPQRSSCGDGRPREPAPERSRRVQAEASSAPRRNQRLPSPPPPHRINRVAVVTTPILRLQSARGLEESQHSSSPAPAQRCRPTPATEPTPPRHSQTLPKAPPEEISSSRSSS